jgi:hypothetical protein
MEAFKWPQPERAAPWRRNQIAAAKRSGHPWA